MATELIATGTTAATSSDIVVTAGAPVTVGLKGVEATSAIAIQLKDDAGAYQNVGALTPYKPALAITAPGTYRLSRALGANCGAFSA